MREKVKNLPPPLLHIQNLIYNFAHFLVARLLGKTTTRLRHATYGVFPP